MGNRRLDRAEVHRHGRPISACNQLRAPEVSSCVSEIWRLDATAQANLVRTRTASPADLIDAAIARIESIDPQLNSVVTPRFERARAEATRGDIDGPFLGVPMLLKDAGQELAGEPHYVGIAALRNVGHLSKRTTRLAEQFLASGFGIVGRAACPAFSAGISTEPPGFAPARNPWALDRTTGGSSGGSAAAVAAGLVPIAHGSDATGSLRYPAAFCGVFTLKPTWGVVDSTAPCRTTDIPSVWSEFVITRSVRDLRALWPVVTGEEFRSTASTRANVALLRHEPIVGVPVDDETVRAIDTVGAALVSLGHTVGIDHPDQLPTIGERRDEWSTANDIIVDRIRAESIVWLSELLGREPTADDVDPEILEHGNRGRALTDDAVVQAVKNVKALINPVATWFDAHTVLVTPVTHRGPWRLGQPEPAGIGLFAAPYSFTGQPAMSIPVGRRSNGTPIGVQLVGAHGSDALLLSIAEELEAAGVACHEWPRIASAS
jgi:amidase